MGEFTVRKCYFPINFSELKNVIVKTILYRIIIGKLQSDVFYNTNQYIFLGYADLTSIEIESSWLDIIIFWYL